MELGSFQELQNRFEVDLEQTFAQWHAQLEEADARGDEKELYYLIKYRLPERVQNWLQGKVHPSGQALADAIRTAISDEEHTRRCEHCEHHQEILERVQMRLDAIPVVEAPIVGPNHLFNQAFGAFGLVGGGIYVGTSYVLQSPAWFEAARVVIALAAGAVCGIIAHRKYHRLYQEDFREQGEVFLKEYQRRIREWFEQMICFSEGEIEFHAR